MAPNRPNVLSLRNAFLLALVVSVAIHLLSLILFYYGRDAVMPHGRGMHRAAQGLDMSRMVVGFLYTFTLVFILSVINFKLLGSNLPNGTKLAFIIVVSLAVTMFLNLGFNSVRGCFSDVHVPRKARGWFFFFRGSLLMDMFVAAIVVFSSQVIYLTSYKQRIALENETLRAENVRTRYEALKNQMDPHFLFNTLNSLNSIIKTDVDKAQEYVQELSQVLRYTLQNRDTITLQDEMNFTRSYCSLMQLRYGADLKFDFNIDGRYFNYYIIPLSVQTLVENAIKHNVITSLSPLTITVRSNADDSLTVSNPMKSKKEAHQGEGIGLANLAERYRLKWGREITIQNTGSVFSVTIPLVRTDENGCKV